MTIMFTKPSYGVVRLNPMPLSDITCIGLPIARARLGEETCRNMTQRHITIHTKSNNIHDCDIIHCPRILYSYNELCQRLWLTWIGRYIGSLKKTQKAEYEDKGRRTERFAPDSFVRTSHE